MAVIVETWTVGPGLFKVGESPQLGAEAQLLAAVVSASESVARTEGRKTLGGGTTAVSEKATYAYAIAGRFLQDIEAAGINAWSWRYKGTYQKFLYVPNEDIDRAIFGFLRPIPLSIGGDVDVDGPEADFTWSIKGEPVFGVYDPVTGTVTPDV